MKSVLRLHGVFRRHLRKSQKKIAPLQILGRLEEYLTKEFASVIISESGDSVLPLTNLGRRNENKIDIALVEGDFSLGQFEDRSFRKDAQIRAFIEVKYFRNMGRIGPSLKNDETSETLNDLQRQLQYFCKDNHSGYSVKLRSKRNQIYGLVIVSYVRDAGQSDKAQPFVKGIVDRAAKMDFCFEDHPRPYVKPVYKDVRFSILKREYMASLYTALWRLNQ